MLSLFKIMLSTVIVVAATADDHIYKLRAIGNLTNTNWKDVINSVTYIATGQFSRSTEIKVWVCIQRVRCRTF